MLQCPFSIRFFATPASFISYSIFWETLAFLNVSDYCLLYSDYRILTPMFSNPLVNKLVDFVRSVGIEVEPCIIDWKSQFPGLDVRTGKVLVDESRLIHPGNILHEAGHIAVHDPERRSHTEFSPSRGEELSALAWSYAATVHLGLEAELVFYPGSYYGWDKALIENFSEGRYVGIPLLQRYGMSLEPRAAAQKNVAPYPHMLKWIR
jgi:hypothetical protein